MAEKNFSFAPYAEVFNNAIYEKMKDAENNYGKVLSLCEIVKIVKDDAEDISDENREILAEIVRDNIKDIVEASKTAEKVYDLISFCGDILIPYAKTDSTDIILEDTPVFGVSSKENHGGETSGSDGEEAAAEKKLNESEILTKKIKKEEQTEKINNLPEDEYEEESTDEEEESDEEKVLESDEEEYIF